MISHTQLLKPYYNNLGQFLEQFIHMQNSPATIKDTKTGQYTVCNTAVAAMSDLLPTEYIGLTVQDIGCINQLKPEVVQNILHMDYKVKSGSVENVQFRQAFFTKKQSILIEEITKKPVLGKNGKVIAILGYSYDMTSYLEPKALLNCYQQYLPGKMGIRQFIRSMQLDQFFYALPTQKELILLLSMRKSAHTQWVANELNMSPKTVSHYKANLRAKLKCIELNELIMRLRVRHEFDNPILGAIEENKMYDLM